MYVGLFLLSMLFTVFNYLPLIEEENPGQRLELCKKTQENSGDEDESPENNENSSEEYIASYTPFIAFDTTTEHRFYTLVLSCTDYTYSRIKPPPEA